MMIRCVSGEKVRRERRWTSADATRLPSGLSGLRRIPAGRDLR